VQVVRGVGTPVHDRVVGGCGDRDVGVVPVDEGVERTLVAFRCEQHDRPCPHGPDVGRHRLGRRRGLDQRETTSITSQICCRAIRSFRELCVGDGTLAQKGRSVGPPFEVVEQRADAWRTGAVREDEHRP
jgi:hypothetical protein